MRPFDFIILFFSFAYTLGLTHLLFAATRMLRHRRELKFSWPHGLWMFAAMLSLANSWLSNWDLREMRSVSLTTLSVGFFTLVCNYFICALVSPDFEDGESFDMVEFHRRESATYIGAFLLLLIVSIGLNYAAASALSLGSWIAQIPIIVAMVAVCAMALALRRPWAQLATATAMVVLQLLFPIIYYPNLTA